MIIGIDPSLSNTGITILNSKGKILLTESIQYYPPRKKTPYHRYFCKSFEGEVRSSIQIPLGPLLTQRRIVRISERVEYLIKVHKVKTMVIEGYSYQSVGRIADLAELSGVIKQIGLRLCSELVIVAPKTLKKFIAGNGNADKDEMILAVNENYFKTNKRMRNLYPEGFLGNSDINDSFCLTQIYQGLRKSVVTEIILLDSDLFDIETIPLWYYREGEFRYRDSAPEKKHMKKIKKAKKKLVLND